MAAVSPPKPRRAGRPYDAAQRRKASRTGREAGCWVYIPVDELMAAGFEPNDPAPYYLTRGYRRSAKGRSVIVTLYSEP